MAIIIIINKDGQELNCAQGRVKKNIVSWEEKKVNPIVLGVFHLTAASMKSVSTQNSSRTLNWKVKNQRLVEEMAMTIIECPYLI